MNLALVLALLLSTAPAPKHHTVNTRPPVKTDNLAPATAYFVDTDGSIYTCGSDGYAMYAGSLKAKQSVFMQILPGERPLFNSPKLDLVIVCMEIK